MSEDEIEKRLHRAKEYRAKLLRRNLSFPATIALAEDCVSDLLDLLEEVSDYPESGDSCE